MESESEIDGQQFFTRVTRIDTISTFAMLGFYVLCAVALIGFLIRGLPWIELLLTGLQHVFEVAAGIVLLCLLLSLIKSLRFWLGSFIFAYSYLLGFNLWLICFGVVYQSGGMLVLIIACAFLGLGVFPAALILAIISGAWQTVITLLIGGGIVLVARKLGVFIVNKS